MKRQKSGIIPVLPIALLVFISGCSSLPFLGGIGQVNYENDVVVIKSLEAIPALAKSSQQIRLVAYIENLGEKKFGQENPVSIDLFDYCAGLLNQPSVKCPEGAESEEAACKGITLLPKETKEIDWVLGASDIKLRSSCELKVSVEYPYKTTGLTSMTFINQKELQTQLERGLFSAKTSLVSKGSGPVKGFFRVEDKQPIPTSAKESYTPVSLQLENIGSGIVKDSLVKIEKENIDDYREGNCAFKDLSGGGAKLVRERASLPCEMKVLQDDEVGKEITRQLEAEISYNYEFRKSVKVTVEPAIF